MVEGKKLKTELLKLAHEKIHGSAVLDIVLNRDVDSDGDPILKIYVIFDNKTHEIDAKESIQMRRFVRERFAKIGETSSPVVYYVAKSEAGKLAEVH